ncbi:dentin sialophosphoprotein-like [Brachionichthys hirsutus]|uniref:dentin sialophosphoprotein-like n=1 Tax=Brachionichthys hirsutus TaxID=412623 RepID=UPI003604D654
MVSHYKPLEECYLCSEYRHAQALETLETLAKPPCYSHPQYHSYDPHLYGHKRPTRPKEDPSGHNLCHHRYNKRVVLLKNSDPSFRKTIVLHRRSLGSFRLFLEEVSELMHYHTRKLYTLEGHKIDSIQSLTLCPSVLICVGCEPSHPSIVEAVQKLSDDKLPKLSMMSQSDGCGDGQEDDGMRDDDDIEKRVRVNKDGSLSMEMKVRFRLQNDETLHWSTEVKQNAEERQDDGASPGVPLNETETVATLERAESAMSVKSTKSNVSARSRKSNKSNASEQSVASDDTMTSANCSKASEEIVIEGETDGRSVSAMSAQSVESRKSKCSTVSNEWLESHEKGPSQKRTSCNAQQALCQTDLQSQSHHPRGQSDFQVKEAVKMKKKKDYQVKKRLKHGHQATQQRLDLNKAIGKIPPTGHSKSTEPERRVNGHLTAADIDARVTDAKGDKSSKQRWKSTKVDGFEAVPSNLPTASPTEVVNDWLKMIPADSDMYVIGEFNGDCHGQIADRTIEKMKEIEESAAEDQRDSDVKNSSSPNDCQRNPNAPNSDQTHAEREAPTKIFNSSIQVMKVLLNPKHGRCNSVPEISPVFGRKLSSSAQGLLDCLVKLQLIDSNPENANERDARYQELTNILQSLWLRAPQENETVIQKGNCHFVDDEFNHASSSGVDVNSGSMGSGKSSAGINADLSRPRASVDTMQKAQDVREGQADAASKQTSERNSEAMREESQKDDDPAKDDTLRSNDGPRELPETPQPPKTCSGNDSSGKKLEEEVNAECQEDSNSESPALHQREQYTKVISQGPDPVWVLSLLTKIEEQFMSHYANAMRDFKVRWNLDGNESLETMMDELTAELHQRIQKTIDREWKKIQGQAGPPRPSKDAMTRSTSVQTSERLMMILKQSDDLQANQSDGSATGTPYSDQRGENDDDYCPCETCIKKTFTSRPPIPAEVRNTAPVAMDFDLKKILVMKNLDSIKTWATKCKTEVHKDECMIRDAEKADTHGDMLEMKDENAEEETTVEDTSKHGSDNEQAVEEGEDFDEEEDNTATSSEVSADKNNEKATADETSKEPAQSETKEEAVQNENEETALTEHLSDKDYAMEAGKSGDEDEIEATSEDELHVNALEAIPAENENIDVETTLGATSEYESDKEETTEEEKVDKDEDNTVTSSGEPADEINDNTSAEETTDAEHETKEGASENETVKEENFDDEEDNTAASSDESTDENNEKATADETSKEQTGAETTEDVVSVENWETDDTAAEATGVTPLTEHQSRGDDIMEAVAPDDEDEIVPARKYENAAGEADVESPSRKESDKEASVVKNNAAASEQKSKNEEVGLVPGAVQGGMEDAATSDDCSTEGSDATTNEDAAEEENDQPTKETAEDEMVVEKEIASTSEEVGAQETTAEGELGEEITNGELESDKEDFVHEETSSDETVIAHIRAEESATKTKHDNTDKDTADELNKEAETDIVMAPEKKISNQESGDQEEALEAAIVDDEEATAEEEDEGSTAEDNEATSEPAEEASTEDETAAEKGKAVVNDEPAGTANAKDENTAGESDVAATAEDESDMDGTVEAGTDEDGEGRPVRNKEDETVGNENATEKYAATEEAEADSDSDGSASKHQCKRDGAVEALRADESTAGGAIAEDERIAVTNEDGFKEEPVEATAVAQEYATEEAAEVETDEDVAAATDDKTSDTAKEKDISDEDEISDADNGSNEDGMEETTGGEELVCESAREESTKAADSATEEEENESEQSENDEVSIESQSCQESSAADKDCKEAGTTGDEIEGHGVEDELGEPEMRGNANTESSDNNKDESAEENQQKRKKGVDDKAVKVDSESETNPDIVVGKDGQSDMVGVGLDETSGDPGRTDDAVDLEAEKDEDENGKNIMDDVDNGNDEESKTNLTRCENNNIPNGSHEDKDNVETLNEEKDKTEAVKRDSTGLLGDSDDGEDKEEESSDGSEDETDEEVETFIQSKTDDQKESKRAT